MKHWDNQYEINQKFKKLEKMKYEKNNLSISQSFSNVYEGYNKNDIWDYVEYIYDHKEN